MNKYILTLAAAVLIATAPAYYAFQAQAEETQPVTEETSVVDCAAVPEDQEIPAECADAYTPAAGAEEIVPANE